MDVCVFPRIRTPSVGLRRFLYGGLTKGSQGHGRRLFLGFFITYSFRKLEGEERRVEEEGERQGGGRREMGRREVCVGRKNTKGNA